MGACDPVRRMEVTPGPAEMVDVLPRDLSTGAAKLLAYRVELLNDHGRSAGRSDAVYAAGGKAPAPVGPLTILPRRGAALIQWRAQPGESAQDATLELHRTLAAMAEAPERSRSERGPSAVPGRPATGTLKAIPGVPFGASKEPPGEVTLTVGAGANSEDRGGTLDGTVRDGDSYVYVAQRLRTVTLSGEDLELRGVASPPATFAYRDTFAPGAPSGLVSVPGGGFAGAPSIDLSWEPNSESDLLGYNVYRRAGPGAFTRLNTEPVPSSSFRDMQAAPDQTYYYRVTAVDRRRNESAPSGEIHESLRK